MNKYFVYIISYNNNSFKVEISENIIESISGFKSDENSSNIKLVFFEVYDTQQEAMKRKSEIETWLKKKIRLVVELYNPNWEDWSSKINFENTLIN